MRKAFIALTLISLLSCVPESNRLDWIEGRWSFEEGALITYEEWEQSGPNEWTGLGYSMDGSDSVFIERMRISLKSDSLYFHVLLPDEENEKQFVNISSNPEILNFYNPENDFPINIVYEKIGTDSLKVGLIGLDTEMILNFIRE